MLAEYGAKIEGIPAGFYAPTNGSWVRLTLWLLRKRANLPLRAIPDVVELFQSLFASTFGADPITPKMALAVADWLEEIEDAQDRHPLAADRPRFASVFPYHDLLKLEADVRRAFLLMAARVPDRAQRYLRRLLGREPDRTVGEIMNFRGTLAQAAPAELVELTLAGLIPKEKKRARSRGRSEAFTHLDSEFLPTSPAQGPFLDLLNAAPEHGLNLVRRLVDHAIAAKSGGRQPVEDGLTLVFPAGPRFFPWKRSYFWSRSADDCYAVESGLLALEAWAHARIERGDPAEQVLVDILGPEGSPAAFLLVAVDILISHWPKTMAAAVPFLGSPELLSLDRNRQIHDEMPEMDLGGWGAIGPREPMGPVQSADLRRRPSRRWALEGLLATFAVDEFADRGALQALLADASARLGPPEPEDNFAEPRFMARYALNLVEPANWRQTERGREYVSPSEEAQHLANLQNRQAAQTLEVGIQASIQAALEDAGRSSPQLAEQAVASAQRLSTMADTSEDARHSRINVIIPAAMILARDGADALLDQHEGWARQVFAQAFASTEHIPVSRTRDGIRFNPVAIAALGVIHLWRRRGRDADRDTLFELVVRDDPYAAQGFGAGLTILRDANSRLVPALLRCALVGSNPADAELGRPGRTEGRQSGAASRAGIGGHQGRVGLAERYRARAGLAHAAVSDDLGPTEPQDRRRRA